jgi:hypothetical protein
MSSLSEEQARVLVELRAIKHSCDELYANLFCFCGILGGMWVFYDSCCVGIPSWTR